MANAPANHDLSPQDVERNELLNAMTNDELVSKIASKYGLQRAAAQRDVHTLMAGRNL